MLRDAARTHGEIRRRAGARTRPGSVAARSLACGAGPAGAAGCGCRRCVRRRVAAASALAVVLTARTHVLVGAAGEEAGRGGRVLALRSVQAAPLASSAMTQRTALATVWTRAFGPAGVPLFIATPGARDAAAVAALCRSVLAVSALRIGLAVIAAFAVSIAVLEFARVVIAL